MEKLVLIIPPSPWLISDIDLPSLGVLYISSYIKRAGYEVDVCDLTGLKEENWKIPVGDIYGITGTSPNFIYIKRIAEILKSRDKDSVVVVGGPHATAIPEHVLDKTLADMCVIGEGEKTMLSIMQDLHTYKHDRELSTRGVCYKKDELFTMNEPRERINVLDSLPYPDYESIDFYKYAPSKTFKYLLGDCRESTILMSRGCPFKCSFCASYKIWKGVRLRTAKSVIEEMNYVHDRYGVELFYFIDDTFAINKWRVFDLCKEINFMKRGRNYKWHCLNRVDCCDEPIIRMMKDAGCIGIVFGFESGSQRILDKANKGTTLKQMYDAIKVVKKYDIKIRGQLIVGLPGENEQTVEETAWFIRNAKEVDAFGIHLFRPFPGCDIWEHPDKYDYEIEYQTDFSDYHTIGKPGDKLTDDKFLSDSIDYLRSIASDRNIELKGAMDD